MSKELVTNDQVLTIDGNWEIDRPYDSIPGIVVRRDEELSNLIGKLLTYVEATYTDIEQRKAHKRLIKNTLYEWYYNNYDDQHKEKSLRGQPLELAQ